MSIQFHEPHVAFYSACWPVGVTPNGIVTYISNLRPGLEKLGVQSRILTKDIGAGYRSSEVMEILQSHSFESLYSKAKHKLQSRISPQRAAIAAASRRIATTLKNLNREWSVDVFEIEESFGLAVHSIESNVVPVVVRLHGPWFLNGKVLGEPTDASFKLRTALEARAIGAAHAICSPSKDVLDRVREDTELNLENAEVIPYPAPYVEASERWDPRLCDPTTILFVGRFDRHKGGDVVIQAFRRVCETNPNAKLLFVGPDRGFVASNGKLWTLDNYLTEYVPESAIRNNIEILGQLKSDDLPPLRRQAAITIIASRYETFCNTVIEAMAFGAPVITSNVGGIRENVKPDKNALIFQSGVAEDLARSINQLFSNPHLAADLGEKGLQQCQNRLSANRIAERMRDFYIRTAKQYRRDNRKYAH